MNKSEELVNAIMDLRIEMNLKLEELSKIDSDNYNKCLETLKSSGVGVNEEFPSLTLNSLEILGCIEAFNRLFERKLSEFSFGGYLTIIHDEMKSIE